MIHKIKYTFILLLGFAFFTGCENDDPSPIIIDAIVANPGDMLNKSLPFNQIRVEGQNLKGLQQIILDNKIDVSFNPNYNSDRAFIFTVPFNAEQGSRFGKQPITFVTASGSITKEFEILQPIPTVESTVPVVAKPGFPLEIVGTWFYNVSSVTFGGAPLTFSVASPTSIVVSLPANAASGSELVVTTPGGVAKKVINFAVVIIVSDFDAAGVRASWSAYGDVDTFNSSASGGPTGNYASFRWAGATSNGYNGSSGGNGGGPGVSFLGSSSNNATRAFLDIDVSADVVGAHVAIQLNTIEGVNYGYNFKISDLNWSTKSISFADFNDNYGYGGNKATNLDVSKINEIKVGIVQGDTPNPTTIKFDNIKIRYQ